MGDKMNVIQVDFIPSALTNNTLYISYKYKVAAHLCACGCGEKVITPIGSAEWNVEIKNGRVSLWPSIGNWQLACRSHYIIRDGKVHWASAWSEEQIVAGRTAENRARASLYASRSMSIWQKLGKLLKEVFKL